MHNIGRQYIILLLVLMAVVFFCGVKYGEYLSAAKTSPIIMGDGVLSSDEKKEIYIEVKGAVKQPGIYVMHEGDRLFDLLKLFDLETGADLSGFNQTQFLYDTQSFNIPYANSSGVNNSAVQPPSQNQGKININTAPESELIKLSGIGAAKAGAIINYRTENGAFKKIEDIKRVSGIGEAIYENIKNDICVD